MRKLPRNKETAKLIWRVALHPAYVSGGGGEEREENQIEPALSRVRTLKKSAAAAAAARAREGEEQQENDHDFFTGIQVPRRDTTTTARLSGTAFTRRRRSRRRRLRRLGGNAGAGLAHPAQHPRAVSRLLPTHNASKGAAGGADPPQLAAQEPARGEGQRGERQQSAGADDGAASPDAAADEEVFRVAAAPDERGGRGDRGRRGGRGGGRRGRAAADG